MGVLACDRSGCSNIMCDRLIIIQDNWYYICGECLEELESKKNGWEPEITRTKMIKKIIKFMNCNVKDSYSRYDTTERDAMFRELTTNHQRS